MSHDGVVIEPLRAQDIPHAVDMLAAVGMGNLDSPEVKGVVDWRNFFGARRGPELLGVAGFRFTAEGKARTLLMVVPEQHRGSGIGMLLQEHRMRHLHDRGVCVLETCTDRPATIAWYKKHFGYVEVGHIPKEDVFSLDDVQEWTLLRCDLDAFFRKQGQ